MTEALYLLSDAKNKRRKEEKQSNRDESQQYFFKQQAQQNQFGAAASGLGMMLNLNEEVVSKTHQYLDQFCRIRDTKKMQELRGICKRTEIDLEFAIKIADLGLSEYEEAVSLYPELKKFEKEKVIELLDAVKLYDQ